MDLARRFAHYPGILFESLSKDQARRCLAILSRYAIAAEALPAVQEWFDRLQ